MIVDTNVYLSRWPFRRLAGDEPEKLVATLRRHGVVRAWAGSFDGILHKDVTAVNARLAADCQRFGNGMLLPFGTVNPALPDWMEDVRRCHERHHMPGIRLHPNYHGYDLSDARFAGVLKAASERRLLVQIVCSMEDVRMQHPLVRVKDVDLAPLGDQLRGVPSARVQLLNWKAANKEHVRQLALGGQVCLDLAMLEGANALAPLLQAVPPGRVLFGSNFPLFYFESALLKLREAALGSRDEQAVAGGNAEIVLEHARKS
jgi:uncharacterized protein